MNTHPTSRETYEYETTDKVYLIALLLCLPIAAFLSFVETPTTGNTLSIHSVTTTY